MAELTQTRLNSVLYALASLGGTDEIARTLSGTLDGAPVLPRSSTRCAVAAYLTHVFDGVAFSVGRDSCGPSAYSNHRDWFRCELPAEVRTFITRFDAGEYEHLFDKRRDLVAA